MVNNFKCGGKIESQPSELFHKMLVNCSENNVNLAKAGDNASSCGAHSKRQIEKQSGKFDSFMAKESNLDKG